MAEMKVIHEHDPVGPCRWCGAEPWPPLGGNGPNIVLITEDGREWFECSWCTAAINDYGLYSDDADGYDAGEIRRRSAQIREDAAA